MRGLTALALLLLGVVPAAPASADANTPVSVRSFVGGNSIALLWNPASGTSPTQYKVYRGGVLKATVSPVSGQNGPGVTTQRWYDTAITNGTAYSYQVSAVVGGVESAKSTALSVTAPATPVTVPTITVASTVPADLVTFMNNGKSLLQTWYPKIVTKLGNSAGTPTSFTLTTTATAGVVAYTSGTTITVGETWARAHLSDYLGKDVFIHEGTHVATNGYVNTVASWINEGVADYVKYYWYNSQTTTNPTAYTYLNGYERAGYFFNWISTTYSKPNFVKDLVVAGKTSGFDVNFFMKTQTTRTLGDLWRTMTGVKLSSVLGPKNSVSGLCFDVPGSNTTPGTWLWIYTCNGTNAQQYTFQPDSYNSPQGLFKLYSNLCLDAEAAGVVDGTHVVTATCNSATASQKWNIQPDFTIMNVNSGKCVWPVANGTVAGTKLELRTCAADNNAAWSTYPLADMREGIGGCLDIWGSGTSPGTTTDLYTCNNTAAQQWDFNPTTPTSTDGALKGLGQCLTVVGGGTADGTLVQMYPCDGTASQKWIFQADGTVKNPNSGKCLRAQSPFLAGVMEIRTCDATQPVFQWKVPFL